MKKGDKVRNKQDHGKTAIVREVEWKIVPGYGIGYRIRIYNEPYESWEPANQWEVIKEEGEHGQQLSD